MHRFSLLKFTLHLQFQISAACHVLKQQPMFICRPPTSESRKAAVAAAKDSSSRHRQLRCSDLRLSARRLRRLGHSVDYFAHVDWCQGPGPNSQVQTCTWPITWWAKLVSGLAHLQHISSFFYGARGGPEPSMANTWLRRWQTCWGDQRSCGIWCLQELCLLPRCRRRRKSELPPPCNRPWWRKLWYCVWSRWNFCWRIRFGWERKWVICRWGEEQKWELVAATMEIGGENRQLG